ncbi:MAG TPA: glycerol-3-phosphate dehydrogenase/oxidase [Candidatus Eisenbacteria bacterium]|nr:glycerol-3-phosphate dehydrogenase/oxidase [Candidatus Eisenbacteria bacterium]
MGGGIHGVAVARDAALRGLYVLLAEAGDLASGTSSRTSKLVHGGIRYLENGQFSLVRESLRERAILLETAPRFVRPIPFLIPHYRGSGRSPFIVEVGIRLYATLARGGSAAARPLREHHHLTPDEAIAREPGLDPKDLLGASTYWDAQMEDARLCVAIATDAARAGADIRTYTRVTKLSNVDGTWRARLRDQIEESVSEATARVVVNAAGPWADEVRGMAAEPGPLPPAVRTTRGTHVVVPARGLRQAHLLSARRDGRVFFAVPWGEHALLGTTDVDDATAPERIAPPAEDIRYLLEETRHALPELVEGVRPVRAFAGLRSLLRGKGVVPWANPREHRILADGTLITLVGGKYTTHRSLAERVTDLVAERLEKRAGPCRTATTPVAPDRERSVEELRSTRRERFTAQPGLSVGEADVAFAVREEKARRLEDVLLRRTRLWLDARAIRAAAEPVARWMTAELEWSESRRQEEIRRVVEPLEDEERRIEEAMR